MQPKRLEPGQDGYVQAKRAIWTKEGCPEPLSILVVEFCGDGDPAFGGSADDRTLGPDGLILTHQMSMRTDPVEFASLELAHEACKHIVNRRPNSLLGILPRWR